MSVHRRKFSDDEKIKVLQEAGEQGISNVLRHHNLSYSVFSRWKKNFISQGIDTNIIQTEKKLLLEENTRLKKIIADMALSLELKNEELLKFNSIYERRSG